MDVVKFQKDSTLQNIKASYIEGGFELSPHEEEIKKRLVHYHSLIFDKKYSKHQAVKIQSREMDVSKATAYRDAQQAEFIFGNIQKTNVEFERAMLKENYYGLYQMNLKQGEFEKAKNALDSYSKLVNWNAEESKINPEKLAASEIIVKLDRQSAKLMKEQFNAGPLDLNQLDVEDVEYKEVEDDKEEA